MTSAAGQVGWATATLTVFILCNRRGEVRRGGPVVTYAMGALLVLLVSLAAADSVGVESHVVALRSALWITSGLVLLLGCLRFADRIAHPGRVSWLALAAATAFVGGCLLWLGTQGF